MEIGFEMREWMQLFFSGQLSYKRSLLRFFFWKLISERVRGGGRGSGAEAGSGWPLLGWFAPSKPSQRDIFQRGVSGSLIGSRK